MTRGCHECRFFEFSPGEPSYSEMTPGSDADLYCTKGHWRIDMFDTYRDDARRMLTTARTCPDFTPDTP